jgi:hypothetical protein
MLAALDHLYLFLGLERPKVWREDLPQEAPKALEPDAQKRFLRAVWGSRKPRVSTWDYFGNWPPAFGSGSGRIKIVAPNIQFPFLPRI